MLPTESENIAALVSRVFRIESSVWGNSEDPKSTNLARFQGRLIYEDSEEAYDRLSELLRPHKITPIFRVENDQQVVILLKGIQEPQPSNPLVNLVLFGLTVLSMLFAGTLYAYEGPDTLDLPVLMPHLLSSVMDGAAFTVSLLAILLAHEFGHYLMSRYHNTAASLPYFIPFPFSPFGTMGAVIFQKEAHKNKRILLDIGLAGPLAGIVVAIPVLLLGLSLSHVEPLTADVSFSMEGNSILYLMAKYAVFGKLLPAPLDYGGLPPLLYWVRYFFTGLPTPIGGVDVMLHPVAWAGWAGLLVTALNLIPAGQLDGGHIVHGLLGERASLLLPVVLVTLALLGFAWSGWWLWVLLTFFLGRSYAEPLDQITPLDGRRKAMAVLGLVIFFLVFTPVPLRIIMAAAG